VNGRQVPVTLPRARFDVNADGLLAVTVDGQPWSPPTQTDGARAADPGLSLRRSDVPWARQQIANELGTPVLVEILDNGQPYNDFVDPDSYQAADDPDPAAASVPSTDRYTPGEPVVISVVVAHTHADERGHVHYRLPATLGDRTVLVHGEASGTTLPLDLAPRPEQTDDAHDTRSRRPLLGRAADAPRHQPGTGRAAQPAEAKPAPVRRDTPDAGIGAL
jgi:hypothetical protein